MPFCHQQHSGSHPVLQKFRAKAPRLRVTGLFDPTIDNKGGQRSLSKENGLIDMLQDYNDLYQQQFDLAGYDRFKRMWLPGYPINSLIEDAKGTATGFADCGEPDAYGI